MSRKNDKRDRLIEAANDLIYQQTFNSTTLADIATKADVPLGNVYYYFKTKDDILKAVVQKRSVALQSQLTALEEKFPNTKERIRGFLNSWIESSDTTAQYGCDIGSLCQELGKFTGELSHLAAEIMNRLQTWFETQFKTLGKGEQSIVLAQHLLSSIQGAALLTLTFKDPNMIKRQSKNIEQWLETAA